MRDLRGKVILVTGGSRGIGAGIVRVLAQAGADVILHYGRSREPAEAIANTLGRDRCHVLSADLEVATAAPTLWRAAVAWKDRIDVLVNNAGIALSVGVEVDFDTWALAWGQTLHVNLVAAAHLCREAIRHFRQRGGGTIINIASRAAFRGDTPDYMHYAASKAGMAALTRSIARGFGRDNIVAFTVAPGFVHTEMAEDFIRQYGEDYVTQDIPLGAMALPEDVGHVVAFCASGLARHATGATIDVNGASYVH